ncbi:hypothetical protein DMUE_1330 [Dictyocoela muelleri]|nr:hypothetical protein DMUE_1330 [Dictyocoela muelleri]
MTFTLNFTHSLYFFPDSIFFHFFCQHGLKKKQTYLKIKEKLEILKYFKSIHIQNIVKLPIYSQLNYKRLKRRSIRIFVDNEKNLREINAINCNFNTNVRNKKYTRLDNILIDRFESVEIAGGSYSDAMLQQKALEIVNKIINSEFEDNEKKAIENFKASVGWLQKYKQMHDINQKMCNGEKINVYSENYDENI